MKGCGVAKTQSIELMVPVDRFRTKKVRIFLPDRPLAPSSFSTGPTNRPTRGFSECLAAFGKHLLADRFMENEPARRPLDEEREQTGE
jgi:hypothetical protein